jgi:hypothetical protein
MNSPPSISGASSGSLSQTFRDFLPFMFLSQGHGQEGKSPIYIIYVIYFRIILIFIYLYYSCGYRPRFGTGVL